MLRTRVCELLKIVHPVLLGGMGSATSAPLVAAVSNAGGLGTLGTSGFNGRELEREILAIREQTDKPFGVNHLLFLTNDDILRVTLDARPAVIAFAWPSMDQDLREYFTQAHAVGSRVLYMTGEVRLAVKAAEAGADIIAAQGNEAGGHVGWIASLPLVPMMVRAVEPVPVIAAGGIADGRGLAAALALGAEGALVGTRFLATHEAPLHPNMKQAIVDSDGHDTVLTEIPDIAMGRVWPGAMSRVRRNQFIERWAGQEWALRQRYQEAGKAALAARAAGDVENAPLFFGQDAGLIDSVKNAEDIVIDMVAEAEDIIQKRLPRLFGG